MARLCKLLGAAVVVLGLALVITCTLQVVRDEDYRKAALVAARNPGNVLYEAEFKGAQVRRAFQITGATAGMLLGLNGLTLVLLGIVAARVTPGAQRL
ncbi:MAG: hypothetical protein HY699_16335 [Deltaproteobacteria bacterium]|nr:hypothetical protein [Deltaproteobacteria bacterium]